MEQGWEAMLMQTNIIGIVHINPQAGLNEKNKKKKITDWINVKALFLFKLDQTCIENRMENVVPNEACKKSITLGWVSAKAEQMKMNKATYKSSL